MATTSQKKFWITLHNQEKILLIAFSPSISFAVSFLQPLTAITHQSGHNFGTVTQGALQSYAPISYCYVGFVWSGNEVQDRFQLLLAYSLEAITRFHDFLYLEKIVKIVTFVLQIGVPSLPAVHEHDHILYDKTMILENIDCLELAPTVRDEIVHYGHLFTFLVVALDQGSCSVILLVSPGSDCRDSTRETDSRPYGKSCKRHGSYPVHTQGKDCLSHQATN